METFQQQVSLLESFRSHADITAVVTERSSCTYAQLLKAGEILARWLCEQGVRPGETIVACGLSSHWIPLLLLATQTADIGLALSPHMNPGTLCCSHWRLMQRVSETSLTETSIDPGALLQACHGPHTIHHALVLEANPHNGTIAKRRCDEDGVVYYTSGSMGRPRVVFRTWELILKEAEAYGRALGLGVGERLLCLVPLIHSYGFGSGMLATLRAGATLCMCEKFRFQAIRDALLRWVPDVVIAGPQSLWLLSRMSVSRKSTRVPPRYVISSGAPLSTSVRQSIQAGWGWDIRQQYGATETGAISVELSKDIDPLSVGRPLHGVRVEIIGGQEVVVTSPYAASGYLHDAGRGSFAGTTFQTGDKGYLTPDGRLRLLGRIDDEIGVSSGRVSVGHIGEQLRRTPGIVSVQVTPVEQRGMITSLEIVIRSQRSAKDVRCAVQERLRREFTKLPYSLHVFSD